MMNLSLNTTLTGSYTSHSQIARILTETWVAEQMFCPKCGNYHIQHFANNKPVADFYCDNCQSQFELKSKNGSFGHTIADGTYDTMISRITSNQNPDFMFMSYSLSLARVTDLLFVPKHFLTPGVIEKRKPLAETARRAGWTGCSIRFDQIPEQGRIPIVANGIAMDAERAVRLVQRAEGLQTDNLEARGWLFDVLNCVNEIPKTEFVLEEVYQSEARLQFLHPNNHNIRAKIRQQLQILRDAGWIEFLDRGHYRKVVYK